MLRKGAKNALQIKPKHVARIHPGLLSRSRCQHTVFQCALPAQSPIQCNALTCVSGWKLNPMHWACSHHALGRATQQIQDGDDGQPAGAASASSVEGGRRGRSDI